MSEYLNYEEDMDLPKNINQSDLDISLASRNLSSFNDCRISENISLLEENRKT